MLSTMDANTSEAVGTGDYVVEKGECMNSIAEKEGCFWETIWNPPFQRRTQGGAEESDGPDAGRSDFHSGQRSLSGTFD